MIRHHVFVRFPSELATADIDELLADVHDVCAPLDGVLDVRIGVNVSPEEPVVHGFRHGFVIDFATDADRDAYLVDEQHGAFGGRLVAAAEGGTDGILVFDLEVA
ncbi:MAG: Dabb family protein [Actinomycetota bacterium]